MNGDVLHNADRQVTDRSGPIHRRNGRRLPTESRPAGSWTTKPSGRAHRRVDEWPAVRTVQPVGGRRLSSAAEYRSVCGDRLLHCLVGGGTLLRDIEAKLRSLDVASAWQGLPDVQVGIVHVNTDRHLAAVLAFGCGWPSPGWVSARASTICATPRAGYVRPG